MATSTRITTSYAGIGQLAKGPQLKAELLRRAERVARAVKQAAADDEQPYIEAGAYVGARRARASVIWRGGLPTELRDRLLAQHIDAARG